MPYSYESNASKKKPASEPGFAVENAIMCHGRSARRPACPKQRERSNYSANCAHERFGAVMLTSKAYIQQAEECLQLANASSDVYVKEALTELASDFKAMAKDLDQRNER